MSIKNIRLFGDPILATKSESITVFDKELRTLIQDLNDTMKKTDAAGLAAPQIGVGLRAFVWDIGDFSGHIINPTIHLGEEIQDGPEGCMSIPNLIFDTKRAMQVLAKGFNQYGEEIEILGSAKLARALQHETDHLDGILFIDRLSREDKKLALKQIRQSEWFNEVSKNQMGFNPIIKTSPHN